MQRCSSLGYDYMMKSSTDHGKNMIKTSTGIFSKENPKWVELRLYSMSLEFREVKTKPQAPVMEMWTKTCKKWTLQYLPNTKGGLIHWMGKIILMSSLENRLQWVQPFIFKGVAVDNFPHRVQVQAVWETKQIFKILVILAENEINCNSRVKLHITTLIKFC